MSVDHPLEDEPEYGLPAGTGTQSSLFPLLILKCQLDRLAAAHWVWEAYVWAPTLSVGNDLRIQKELHQFLKPSDGLKRYWRNSGTENIPRLLAIEYRDRVEEISRPIH